MCGAAAKAEAAHLLGLSAVKSAALELVLANGAQHS